MYHPCEITAKLHLVFGECETQEPPEAPLLGPERQGAECISMCLHISQNTSLNPKCALPNYLIKCIQSL